jgi:archaellum component FlaC
MQIIEKVLKNYGWIQRSSIEKEIKESNDYIQNRCNKEKEEELTRLKRELEDKHFREISKLQAVITSLENDIDHHKEKFENARKAYKNYKNDLNGISALTADVFEQVSALFNTNGETFNAFVNIRKRVDTHLTNLNKYDETNSKLLELF